MEYEELFDLKNQERKSTEPTEVPKDLYQRIATLVKDSKKKDQENIPKDSWRGMPNLARNVRMMAETIYNERELKAWEASKAMTRGAAALVDVSNFTPEERQLIIDLRSVLEKHRTIVMGPIMRDE